MVLPEFMLRTVKKEMQRLIGRVPEHVRNQVRNEFEMIGPKVTLFVCRPSWEHPEDPDKWSKTPIAQFRYDLDENWSLYWQRSNGKWLLCDWIKPQSNFEVLVDGVEKDPFGTFWG